MNLEQKQEEIIEEFGMFEEWMEKYEHIIELGKELAPMDSKYKTNDYIIKGCQSKVWLQGDVDEQGKVRFTADSDAIITKGMVALMVRVLDNESPEDIVKADLHFINDIGLNDHLSPTRSNGLAAMIKQMKYYGLAVQAKK